MVAALTPGCWLLIDDFDCSWLPFVPHCREDADARLFLKTADAFHHVLEAGGVDIARGRGFYPLLLAHGLVNVRSTATLRSGREGPLGPCCCRRTSSS
jgi:hypothetical protein